MKKGFKSLTEISDSRVPSRGSDGAPDRSPAAGARGAVVLVAIAAGCVVAARELGPVLGVADRDRQQPRPRARAEDVFRCLRCCRSAS